MVRGLVVAVAVLVAGTAVAGASAHSGHRARPLQHVHIQSTPGTLPMRTALMEPSLFQDGTRQAEAFALTRAAGATYVRLTVDWAQLVPAVLPSAGFTPSDPESAGYRWSVLDEVVEAAEKAGLTPILDVQDPPNWATLVPRQGDRGPKPKPGPLGTFARALARHYDGTHGAPAEHVFQVWNEPNLSIDLDPVSPVIYRQLVNALAAGVHSVNRRNIVVAGGLDPFQNRAARFHTMAPLAFMRKLLCLSKGAHPHLICKARVHFDVWSHHPYTFGGPFGHARLPDDVSLGDLPKMTKLLHAAERLHRIASTGKKVQFWVTEFGWDTKPPNPHGLKLALQARGTAEALHQMWLNGISLVTWYTLQDQPLSSSPYQTGLYFDNKPIGEARPKPTLTAFRFPFVAYRKPGGEVDIWGRDATSDKKVVTIQLRHRGRWRTVARIRANRYGIFLARLRLVTSAKDRMRAIASGSGKSLVFSLKQPHYPHIGPWGS